jgi:hypothetical protein
VSNHPHNDEEWVLEFLPASRTTVEPVRGGGAGRPFSLPLSARRVLIGVPIVILFFFLLGLVYGPKTPKALSYHSWHTLQYVRLLNREISQLDQAMAEAEGLKSANPFEAEQAIDNRLILLNRLKAEHDQTPTDYPQMKDVGDSAIQQVIQYLKTLADKKKETALTQFNPDQVAADEANAQNDLQVLKKQAQWMQGVAGL